MILGHVNSKEDITLYPKAIQKAIEYLRVTDIMAMEPGKYPIDGDDMIVQVIETKTGARETKRPEIHHKYVDVQFLVKGEEKIGFYADMGDNEIDEDFSDTRDLVFYKNNKNAKETFCVMSEGSYAVFFPADVHTPAVSVNTDMDIKKVVVKVSVSSLKK